MEQLLRSGELIGVMNYITEYYFNTNLRLCRERITYSLPKERIIVWLSSVSGEFKRIHLG